MKRPHFALPEIYDESLSYYDVLRKLIKSMHVISDNLNKIPEQIANEAKARLLGDQGLQTNIDNEAQAREQADTTLQQNINSEATTREQADQEIREGVANNISELKGDLANKLPKSPANWGPWTAEEQAVARERIGIDKPFELIETIKIDTDDIAIIKRDVEPDGTPYNFESMMVIVTSFSTNMSGLIRAVYGHRTDNTKFDFDYSSITNSVGFNNLYLLCEKRNGIWNVECIISHTNGVARGYYVQPELRNMDKKTITGVSIRFNQSNFIAGTEIKIYGVRA